MVWPEVVTGDVAEAHAAYQEALQIARALAKAEPEDVGYQRDLFVGMDRMGVVLLELGQMDDAIDWLTQGFHQAKIIFETHRSGSAGRSEWDLSHQHLAKALIHRGIAYESRGQITRAIADFEKSIALQPNDRVAQFNYGRLLFHLARFEEAAKSFRRVLQVDPDWSYGPIWLILAEASAGRDGREALAQNMANAKPTPWSEQIVSFLLGMITPAALIRAAKYDNAKRQPEQLCEAYFYAGQMKLIEGNRKGAVDLFEKSIATGLSNFIEFRASEAELRRLGIDPDDVAQELHR